jgi:putative toxin-antitoxin system antitoxin component (TIGR02293 family)
MTLSARDIDQSLPSALTPVYGSRHMSLMKRQVTHNHGTRGSERPSDVERAAKLLGGRRLLKRDLKTRFDAHEAILSGLPSEVLLRLAEKVTILRKPEELEKALGISVRTFQRRKKGSSEKLSQEQSGRAWKFAEIVGKATEVFGSTDEAEHFLEKPAIGLDQNRPLDLLTTPAGVELVETYLERIRYGVYT